MYLRGARVPHNARCSCKALLAGVLQRRCHRFKSNVSRRKHNFTRKFVRLLIRLGTTLRFDNFIGDASGSTPRVSPPSSR